jgi:hypothetical protein
MDTFEGDLQSPMSLHKYLYASADPVDRTDSPGTQDTAQEAEAEVIGEIIDATPYVRGAALLLFLAAQFSGGIVESPDVATPDAGRDPRYPNRMRVQLQEGLDNTFYGVAQQNTDQVGVTVSQMQTALFTLYNTAASDTATGRNAYPFNALDDWLRSAVIFISQDLKRYPPTGVIGLQRNFLQQTTEYRGKEYRLDVDNLVGHNLRQYKNGQKSNRIDRMSRS